MAAERTDGVKWGWMAESIVRGVGAVLIVWLVGHAGGAPAADAQVVQAIDVDGPSEWGDAVRLVEEVRIGTIEGDPDYAFGSVTSVAVTEDGTVWVGDSQLGAIQRYGPDGGYLGQVGRKGEGPGEFVYPTSMRVLSDGTVAVWDAGQIRVSRFAPDGSFRDSFSPATYMIGGESFEVDPDDNLYLFVSNIMSLTPDSARSATASSRATTTMRSTCTSIRSARCDCGEAGSPCLTSAPSEPRSSGSKSFS